MNRKYPRILSKGGEKDKCLRLAEREGVPFFESPVFDGQDWLLHGFSTRLGGVSDGIYRSMNLSFHNGDRRENVLENYRRMGRAIGFCPEQTAALTQIHSARVYRVGKTECGFGVGGERSREGDAMATDEPGVVLMAMCADCVPILLADPVNKAVAAVHSGWRGTTAKIAAVTVEKMKEWFGSDPGDILAAVGASICRDCYEVGEEVILEVEKAFGAEMAAKGMYIPGRIPGKYQLDLWETNRQVLLMAGLKPEKICLPGVCTCCNPELLFSHRATKGKRGTMAAFTGIR